MSRRVFLHVGLPKTGTSYLQTILWAHRDRLRAAGLLVPGRERRDHLWSSLVVRGDRRLHRRGPRAPEAWDVVRAELREWAGDGLVSHEFFCSATAEQARAVVEALSPAEVHVVVTAREPLSLFTSSWQEHLKNKGTTRIGDYAREVSDDPLEVWNWRALDLALVLDRWAGAVPDDRVHVVTMPGRGDPPDELWRRFCGVVGVDPGVADASRSFRNSSMGVVEAETLRRVNERLTGFDRAFDRGVWIRSFLADDRLVPRAGEPFWPGPEQVADCRRRGEAAVALLRGRGFDVVGDPDSLLVPAELAARRHPDDVTDAEVAGCAVDLVATLLGDVRDRNAGPRPVAGEPPGDDRPQPGAAAVLRRLLRRR